MMNNPVRVGQVGYRRVCILENRENWHVLVLHVACCWLRFFFFLGGGGGGKFDTIEMQTEQERANFREEKLRPATDSKMLFYWNFNPIVKFWLKWTYAYRFH